MAWVPAPRSAGGPPVIPRELRELEANPPDPNEGDQGPDGMGGYHRVRDWMGAVGEWYTALGIDADWDHAEGLVGWSGLPWAIDEETGNVISHPRRGKKAGQR
jgi:hypothetical protein